MHRLTKYQYIIKASIASKGAVFFIQQPKLFLKIVAGLYKPPTIRLEHGLILASLSGSLPVARNQLHGKRQKRTVSLNNALSRSTLQVLDKTIHELLPRVSDFVAPTMRKPSCNNYTLRLKQKFSPLSDFEDLVSSTMYDDYRGIFLPLNIHILLSKSIATGRQIGPHYMRMLRLPFNFHNNRKTPIVGSLGNFNYQL